MTVFGHFAVYTGKTAMFGSKSPFYPTYTTPRGEMMCPVDSSTPHVWGMEAYWTHEVFGVSVCSHILSFLSLSNFSADRRTDRQVNARPPDGGGGGPLRRIPKRNESRPRGPHATPRVPVRRRRPWQFGNGMRGSNMYRQSLSIGRWEPHL